MRQVSYSQLGIPRAFNCIPIQVAKITAEYIGDRTIPPSKGNDGDSGVALSSVNIDIDAEDMNYDRNQKLKHVAPGVEIERIERSGLPKKRNTPMAGRKKHSQGLDASRPFLSTIELHVSNLQQVHTNSRISSPFRYSL